MSSDFEEVFVDFDSFRIVVIYNKKLELIERIKFVREGIGESKDSFIKRMIVNVFLGREKVNPKFLNFNNLTNFQKRVLLEVLKIPRGKVSTYKSISIRAGVPRGARSVGNVMKFNPFPVVIPCHRVIKSDRSIGKFGGGVNLKKKLLIFEGVEFGSDGKVLNKFVV